MVRVTDNTLQLLVAGVQGQPPSPAQLQEVRQKAAAKLQDLGPAAVLQDRASNDSKISQSRRRPYYDLLLVKLKAFTFKTLSLFHCLRHME